MGHRDVAVVVEAILDHPAIHAANSAITLQAVRSGTKGYTGPDFPSFLREIILSHMQQVLKSVEEKIRTTEPSPELTEYIRLVKRGNKDDMYDYGVRITREMCISFLTAGGENDIINKI